MTHKLLSIVVIAFVLCMVMTFAQTQGNSRLAIIGIGLAMAMVFIVGRNRTARRRQQYETYNKYMRNIKLRQSTLPDKVESMPVGQPGPIGQRVHRYHGEVEYRQQAIKLKDLAFGGTG